MKYIIAIDQGTTSTRSILFDETMNIVATSQQEFPQIFPDSGWVEHNPDDLLETTIKTCKDVIEKANISITNIQAMGITNQRETTILWNKHTGKPIYNAIVWQDRRTVKYCQELQQQGHADIISYKTGLVVDSYFSATKIRWILDHTNTQAQAENGDVLFGSVDSYLIWHLTQGKSHMTDATNASRTMLYNIREGRWSTDICKIMNIPRSILPEVKNCADDFGVIPSNIFGHEIPIHGVAGDQQSATIGQACFHPGMIKATYGTGCFMLLNTGDSIVKSNNHLLSTIAYQLDGKITYALEGSIFIAGSVVQWLRDGLGIIKDATETQALAEQADPKQSIYLVPAFTGLGAPYWDMQCRGGMFGITRNTGPAEIVKSALQSVGYQTKDLIQAMQSDWNVDNTQYRLRIDGGMASSQWTMQFVADIIGTSVDRPHILETTALGVAWLAGMYIGMYPNQSTFESTWQTEHTFTPSISIEQRETLYLGWQNAIQKILL